MGMGWGMFNVLAGDRRDQGGTCSHFDPILALGRDRSEKGGRLTLRVGMVGPSSQ